MKQHSAVCPFSRPQHGSMPTPRRLLRLLTVTVCLSFAQPFASVAQTNAPAPLPPAAQEAVNKGIIAAKVPDYLLAIRFFEEARKIAPQAPVIYLNLGLAESRIPGRELRAIAWYGAYLAAYLDAPNAAAVKEQIAVLDVRNQSNVSRLIKSAQDAVNQMPVDRRDSHLSIVAWLWGRSGDVNAALNAIDFIRNNHEKEDGLRDVARSQADLGDIAGAQKIAGLIQSADARISALSAIGLAQADDGDIAGAQKTIALIQDKFHREAVLIAIASAQARSGNIEAALKTANLLVQDEKVEAVLRKYSNQDTEERDGKSKALLVIVEALANRADIAGAQKIIAFIPGPRHKSDAQTAIAEAQVKAGDIAAANSTIVSAKRTADLIQDAFWKSNAQMHIAWAQAKNGDIAGAQATISLIQDADRKEWAQKAVSDARARTSFVNMPASDWLGKLDDADRRSECPLSASLFLDLAGYLKSLPPSDNPEKVFEALRVTVRDLNRAQYVVHQMLKQQARK